MLTIDTLDQQLESYCRTALALPPNSVESWCAFTVGLYGIVDQYVDLWIEEKKIRVDCRESCSHCCSHWVEDVYSFEAVTILTELKTVSSVLQKRIGVESYGAVIEFQEICNEMPDAEEIAVLQKFYSLDIPCPLSDFHGNCRIYQVRPLTCRLFFSRDCQRFCKQPVCDDESGGTFTVPLSETIDELLDNLHFLAEQALKTETALRAVTASLMKNKL